MDSKSWSVHIYYTDERPFVLFNHHSPIHLFVHFTARFICLFGGCWLACSFVCLFVRAPVHFTVKYLIKFWVCHFGVNPGAFVIWKSMTLIIRVIKPQQLQLRKKTNRTTRKKNEVARVHCQTENGCNCQSKRNPGNKYTAYTDAQPPPCQWQCHHICWLFHEHFHGIWIVLKLFLSPLEHIHLFAFRRTCSCEFIIPATLVCVFVLVCVCNQDEHRMYSFSSK